MAKTLLCLVLTQICTGLILHLVANLNCLLNSMKFKLEYIFFRITFIFYTILGQPDDEQMDCVAKLAPIVAMYAGHPDLLVYVEQIVRMTEDNDVSVAIGLATARCMS